jgi:hypothetical protein
VNHVFPLNLGLLEIDEKTEGPAGSPEVVETLRRVLVCEAVHAFQFYYQDIFYKDIREIFSNGQTLVGHCKRCLGGSLDATNAKFSQKSAFVNLLEKSGSQRVGDLQGRAQHALGQRIENIRVHRRSSAANIYVPS